MKLEEIELSAEPILTQGSMHLFKSEVVLPNGRKRERVWIKHNGSIAIVAVNDEGRIAIEDQYRFAIKTITHEIPAGHREEGEDELEGAKRELLEETGYSASSYTFLGYMTPSGSTSTEKTAIFFATGLKKIREQALDEDEFINVSWLTLDEIDELIKQGQLWDPKTICGLYMARINKLL